MAKIQASASSDTASAEAAATVEVAGQVIYLGPRLLKPVHVVPNAVYRGELPAELAALAAKDGDVRACIVPVDQAGKALRGSGAAALAEARANVTNRYLGRK